jgi:hypothetical protein
MRRTLDGLFDAVMIGLFLASAVEGFMTAVNSGAFDTATRVTGLAIWLFFGCFATTVCYKSGAPWPEPTR